MRKFLLILLVIFWLPGYIFPQPGMNYIRVHLKNETLQGGKLIIIDYDYYFDAETGTLVVNSLFPENHIKISNRLGEVKIYYTDKNQVSLKQNQFFSSENELIYYFLSNNYYDLGLKDQGFTVTETRMDGNYQVVTWKAPVTIKTIARVELVFENQTPVFAAYYTMQGKIFRKIYYYNYEIFNHFIMPMKVTQISYTPAGDSVIQRNTWSQLKTMTLPDSDYFNFKIPENATIIQ